MIYFDNAATSFKKPPEVIKAFSDAIKNYSCGVGRSGYTLAFDVALKVEETREQIRKLFNLKKPQDVIFTINATQAINFALKGIIKQSDHFIISSFEHNAVYRPSISLLSIGAKFDIAQVDINDDIKTVENFVSLINQNTKLICVNHVSNVFGNVLPIKKIFEIAKKSGIITMLDASQSAGIFDIDMQRDNIDILCCPGHKSLFGPQGTGVLCINNDEVLLSTIIEGGTGSNSNDSKMPIFLPDRLESGTQNIPGIIALCEGIKFVSSYKTDEILNYELELSSYIIDSLKEINDITVYDEMQNKSGVFSFNIESLDSEIVCHLLDLNNICIRSGFHCAMLAHNSMGTNISGTVRVSPNIFNTKSEAQIFIDTIYKISK